MDERRTPDFQAGLATGAMAMFDGLMETMRQFAAERDGDGGFGSAYALGIYKTIEMWQEQKAHYLEGILGSEEAMKDVRPLNLYWDGNQYRDRRCGCAYHPDDGNETHSGAPHVHRCQEHEAS